MGGRRIEELMETQLTRYRLQGCEVDAGWIEGISSTYLTDRDRWRKVLDLFFRLGEGFIIDCRGIVFGGGFKACILLCMYKGVEGRRQGQTQRYASVTR